MLRAVLYLSIFFTISTIAYNNCAGGKFEATGGLNIASASAQCRQKIMASSKISPELDPSICERGENYQCDIRHFRPNVAAGKFYDNHCLNITNFGKACVAINTYNYNTSTQLQKSEAPDLSEGAPYNRDEASCINTQITNHDIALIQGDGATLEEALYATIEQCRQRSRL